jgi:Rps23 Pro-64 3,4-dihydroxylase Tpa1-like proline 4-hydroxylase
LVILTYTQHKDNDPDGKRLFTILFFLNSDRNIDQGSLLKLYTNNDVINVVPNFNQCILLEHQNYNYTHEVTHNLVDDVRYSIYSPFTISDYNEKLEDL